MVNWILYKQVLPISKEHLDAFTSVWFPILWNGNFRECQPLCGRRIVRNFEKLEDDLGQVQQLNEEPSHRHEVYHP